MDTYDLPLPTSRGVTTHRYLIGVNVGQDTPLSSTRIATVTPLLIGFRVTMPDDWLTLDDLQAIVDQYDIKYGKPLTTLRMPHYMRRAIIVLMDEQRKSGQLTVDASTGALILGDVQLLADKDLPPRTFEVLG